MRIVITGVAGFIGSHLASQLARQGHDVVGVDCFTPYYDRELKQRNLVLAGADRSWKFLDRRASSLTASELEGVDVIVHLAAQPGVRLSWSEFATYTDLNLQETNALADVAVRAGVPRVVFASSSSVYGDGVEYPTRETSVARPRSPYGVTKLAGESLWQAYTFASSLEVLALRFFTVYGPGQRPDMATQRLVRAAIHREPFTLYGDGEQRRDFTYVGDVVRACAAACAAKLSRQFLAVNVGGSGDTSMNRLIELVEAASGRPLALTRGAAQRGDVLRTGADAHLAGEVLGWHPEVIIDQGVQHQVAFELAPSPESWDANAE